MRPNLIITLSPCFHQYFSLSQSVEYCSIKKLVSELAIEGFVEETPPPILQIPPTQQIVPTWIYVLIGIGAAPVVVVIVLIVRTRRP
jgi:hypothetical protein